MESIAPVMSENVWAFIVDKVQQRRVPSFLEYGSGGSTLYLYRLLFEKAVHNPSQRSNLILTAVESDFFWFANVIEHIHQYLMEADARVTRNVREELRVRRWPVLREASYFLSLPRQWKYLLLRRKAASIREGLLRRSVMIPSLTDSPKLVNPRSMVDADYVLTHRGGLRFHYFLRSLVREDWRDETRFCEHYVAAPSGKFDFVLIDGSHRKECLNRVASSAMVRPLGIVFHHDAYKDGHQDVIRNFGGGDFLEGSGVGMTPGASYQGKPIPNELWYWSPESRSDS